MHICEILIAGLGSEKENPGLFLLLMIPIIIQKCQFYWEPNTESFNVGHKADFGELFL